MSRIIVLGSLNIDLSVAVPALPSRGETVLGQRLERRPGGKGANQAVAAARLGGTVAMYGRVGDDPFGAEVIDSLRASGVDVRGVRDGAAAATGAALIVVDEIGDNIIAVASGANAIVDREDVGRLAPELVAGDVLVLQLEIPLDVVRAAASAARTAGARVLINAAPAPKDGLTALPAADVLVVNETEASALAGTPVQRIVHVKHAAMALSGVAPAVVVTLGAQGAVLVCDGKATHVSAPSVSAVDATGAGDAFVGALAYGLATSRPIVESVRLGVLVASLSVTRAGAQDSFPSLAELDKWTGRLDA